MDLDYRESRRVDQYGNQFKYRAKVYDKRGASVAYGTFFWSLRLSSSLEQNEFLRGTCSALVLLRNCAFAYFSKPFNLDEVEDAVNRAIGRHQELIVEQGEPILRIQTSQTEPASPREGRTHGSLVYDRMQKLW